MPKGGGVDIQSHIPVKLREDLMRARRPASGTTSSETGEHAIQFNK
jgi:hypothetical protein